VLLPHFKEQGKPFMLLYWSSDPDGTQHSQRDSVSELDARHQRPDLVRRHQGGGRRLSRDHDDAEGARLDKTTNIFVTADHGFSTVSKQSKTSPSTRNQLPDDSARVSAAGFLAIDLAEALDLPLHEPSPKARRRLQRRQASAPRQRDPRQDPAKPEWSSRQRRQRPDLSPAGQRQELAPKVVKACWRRTTPAACSSTTSSGAFPARCRSSPSAERSARARRRPRSWSTSARRTIGCDQPLFCAVTVTDATADAGPGPSRQLQPRRHGEFHGRDRPGLQGGLQSTRRR
jgi:hypothetical protein